MQKQDAKISLMSDIIKNYQDVIQDLMRKMDNVELAQAKKSAILTGLSFSLAKKEKEV